jgi:hypothetical protein
MLKSHIRRGILLFCILLVPALSAQQLRFEAVMTGRVVVGCMILPISFSAVQWVNPDRLYTDPNTTSETRSVTSAPGLPVFALRDGDIINLQPDGTHTVILAGSFYALTVAPSGRFFATTGTDLSVISSAGVLEATYPLPGATPVSALVAVASDGCTVYYRKSSSIGRVNGCTGAPLSDFMAINISDLYDIHPLPNGQVLIARTNGVDLHDASGSLIRNVANIADYGFDPLLYAPYQVAATPDGQVVWMAILNGCEEMGSLVRVAIQDGHELSRVDAETSTANGLVIGTATTAGVPTAGNLALAAFAIVLACTGALLLRR